MTDHWKDFYSPTSQRELDEGRRRARTARQAKRVTGRPPAMTPHMKLDDPALCLAWLSSYINELKETPNRFRAEIEWLQQINAMLSAAHAPQGGVRADDAALIEELRGERDAERAHRQKLQAALGYWMPSVTPETDAAFRSAGDDACLLAGYEGDITGPCWGDDVLAERDRYREALTGLSAGLKRNPTDWSRPEVLAEVIDNTLRALSPKEAAE